MATTPAFTRYIGIDYSGAETPTSSLKGLRVYLEAALGIARVRFDILNPDMFGKEGTRAV